MSLTKAQAKERKARRTFGTLHAEMTTYREYVATCGRLGLPVLCPSPIAIRDAAERSKRKRRKKGENPIINH